MLGLVNTVSSGSTLEALYSIILNGSDDYVDLGETFNSVFQGHFSISIWVNFADKDPSGNEYVFGSEIGTEDAIWFSQTSSQTYVFHFKSNNDEADSNAWSTGYNDGDDGETGWQHFVFVVKNRGSSNASQILCYQNAVLKTAVTGGLTGTNHAAFTSTNLFLGAKNNDGTAELFSDSKISDFAIWNALLDGAAVTAIYNSGRPTNLTFDDGGSYDNSSALQAYYKMGNGRFDDKPNGVIHDQHAPGFEADLIAANGGLVNSFSGNFTHSGGLMTVTADGNQNWNGGNVEALTVYKATVDIVSGVTGKIFIGGTSSALFSGNGVNVRYVTTSNTASLLTYVSFNDCADMVVRSLKVEKLKGFPGLTSGGPTFSSDTP